jgi:competence protein ComEC
MSSWILPASAVAFWAGVLASGPARAWVPRVPPWIAIAVGLSALAAGWVAAPPMGRLPNALEEARLVAVPSPAAAAITASHADRRRAPGPAAALALAGLFALGAGWSGLHEVRLETSVLARIAPARVSGVGTFRTDPSSSAFGWSGVLDLGSIRWEGGAIEHPGSVWVGGDGRPPAAVRGDRVRVEGVVRRPENPGFADALHRLGVAVELDVAELQRLGGSTNPLVRAAQGTRVLVGRSIAALFPPREAGLLLGLALGDDSELDPGLERDFRATSLGHLLVVSGGNVAMVLAPVLGLTVALRLGSRSRFLVATGTVAFFVVLTGAEPSVLRAGVMATLALFGMLLGRPRSSASILAGAVLVLLVLDPRLVWSIGFQLSVVATAGMVALATPIAERLRFVPKPVAVAAGATLGAQVAVTPILLFHFHEVPGVTVLANLAAFPAVPPALLLGFAAAAIGLVWFPLGDLLAWLASLPLRYLELVADALGKAPVAHITSGGGIAVLVVGVAVVVGLGWWLRSGRAPPRRAVVAGAVALPVLVWSTALGTGPPAGLVVRFFDVGQGDAALVTSPGGANVLVDGGPDDQMVATELAALGVKRLDVVIATHPHADHIIGLPTVLSRVPVGLVLEPGCPDTSAIQAELDRAIASEGVPVRHPRMGDSFSVGDLRLDVLSPDRCWTNTESDANNDSLVVVVTFLEDTILFAGEPEEPAQEVLLEAEVSLVADVLKVPHHGAATSLPELFPAVDPQVAVVSVGPNDYGHPVPAIMDAIAETGAAIWRTDRRGDVVLRFDGPTPTVESDR